MLFSHVLIHTKPDQRSIKPGLVGQDRFSPLLLLEYITHAINLWFSNVEIYLEVVSDLGMDEKASRTYSSQAYFQWCPSVKHVSTLYFLGYNMFPYHCIKHYPFCLWDLCLIPVRLMGYLPLRRQKYKQILVYCYSMPLKFTAVPYCFLCPVQRSKDICLYIYVTFVSMA